MQIKTRKFSGFNSLSSRLLAIFTFSLLGLILFHLSRQKEPQPSYSQMLQAAERMQQAIAEIRKFRQELNLPIDPVLDPGLSGFIGSEITPLTTTLGNLEAKQTALNPDFAALILRWFRELDIQKGETVALQLSGSFPALNIAAIIACDVSGVNPVIISSIGASSFGANLPGMSYPDIEKRLYEKGMIQHRSHWVTLGGNNDREILLWEEADSIVNQIIKRTGDSLFYPRTLKESIHAKWEFFNRNGKVRVFINIGGNQAALGNCPHSSRLPVGLIKNALFCLDEQRGLMMKFWETGTPVIHFLNIRSLAIRESLPLTPIFSFKPGSSDIYFKIDQPRWVKIILIIFLAGSWLFLRNPQRIPRSSRTTSTNIS